MAKIAIWCWLSLGLLLLQCSQLSVAEQDVKEKSPNDIQDDVKKDPRGPVDKDKMIEEDAFGHLVQPEKSLIDVGFIHAFVASLSVIFVSELGDKTFFIAAIMAMRHPRLTIYLAAMGALGLMTIMSALLGHATTVIPGWFTFYVSAGLFAIFGLKMIREGYNMSPEEGQEELEEAQAEVRKKEEELESLTKEDVETGIVRRTRRFWQPFCSGVFLQAFSMTFVAEWGDRSQIATIILAARDEVIGVILGGTLGHALCTGLAVMGGRLIAQRISLRTVHLIGGVVFIIFALSAFLIEPDD